MLTSANHGAYLDPGSTVITMMLNKPCFVLFLISSDCEEMAEENYFNLASYVMSRFAFVGTHLVFAIWYVS